MGTIYTPPSPWPENEFYSLCTGGPDVVCVNNMDKMG